MIIYFQSTATSISTGNNKKYRPVLNKLKFEISVQVVLNICSDSSKKCWTEFRTFLRTSYFLTRIISLDFLKMNMSQAFLLIVSWVNLRLLLVNWIFSSVDLILMVGYITSLIRYSEAHTYYTKDYKGLVYTLCSL